MDHQAEANKTFDNLIKISNQDYRAQSTKKH